MVKNILVIGGNRFFGRHLVSALIKKGHKPVLFNRQNYNDGFGDCIERVKGDRDSQVDLSQIAKLKKWDFVFDQVCFTATQAKQAVNCFENQVGRYIVTSTKSVYNLGVNLTESSFYPQSYEYKVEADRVKEYGEAKRQMESVFYQQKKFLVTAVRFPIVLGVDDYTKRLVWHFDRLRSGKGIYLPNLDARMDFVDSVDAGEVLEKLMNIDWSFPLNVCSPDSIILKEFMGMIEKQVGRNFKFEGVESNDNVSPFGIKSDSVMNVDQMLKLGLKVKALNQWLPKLITQL